MIGKTINNYVIERKLGDGGMGEVFYARHNKVDREVAIKVLYSHLFSNESIHNRFKNEANALIKLNHPNIVKIYDYVEQENFACLIMEYINGYTLDTYIKKLSGPLPSVKATSIICSVLDAVQYAHNSNIYHRDIKPANIMISADGAKVRIMDFGIAKLTDSKNFKTTHANTQLGTPFYMSPEQVKGIPYSRMSDIYSLGVTLFEMVTGKCPYHQINSLFELQSKIVNEPLPPTDLYVPGVSPKIQQAIIKATQKNPDARFQSCEEFKRYLQDFDQTIITIPEKQPGRIVRPEKRNALPWYILGGIAFTAILIILIVSLSGPSEKPPPQNQGVDTTKVEPPTIDPDVERLNNIKAENKKTLEKYFNSKDPRKYYPLKEEKREEITKEIDSSSELILFSEMERKYDRYFILRPPPVIIPGDNQIEKDFWNEANKLIGTIPCILPLDDLKQIRNIKIPKFPSNPSSEVSIDIKYDIYEDVNSQDPPESCTLKLRYIRRGNEYIHE